MAGLVKETTRVFNISLPEKLAQKVEEAAHDQKADVNELVQWAIRVYLHHNAPLTKESNEPINPDHPESMSMAQVNALVHEVRRDVRREEEL
jgi:hypothetical protein